MHCPKCRVENPEGAKFCGECGSSLVPVCPNCGVTPPPGIKFCHECGHKLSEPKQETEIDYDQPQSYTPKPLANKILKERKSIEGERKLVTVFFADVTNYTSMSEKFDPEVVHGIIDGWYKIVMDHIHHCEGTITQFMGDGVMALFGAPVAHEDHARRACLAALAIQEDVKEYAKKINSKYDIDFRMRVGLNSGLVIVSSIGDDLKMDYTALGDTVNTASRMETAARPGVVLVSENTYKLVKNYFELESGGEIKVKGKDQPLHVYEVTRPSDVETRLDASARRGFTKFIGRKREIEDLQGAFNKARSGSGQVTGIVGEAGVGKSRLLYEFRNLLSPDEYSYFEGRCIQYGGGTIYMPILDILRSFFSIKEGESESVVRSNMENKIRELDENLSSSIPPLQELLSLKVDDEEFAKLEPKEKREKTFEAIRNLLIRISHDKPLVIAVEDLHWMDKTSEEFLNYLIGYLANADIQLVLLYRPEYTHQWGNRTYYNRISLDQLALDDCAELVRSILGEGELDQAIRELVFSRAAGNPLFMEEMTHTLLENGTIRKEDDKFILTVAASEVEVPETVQGIIAARMDRLEEDIKRTMQMASVIGRDFAFRILEAVSEMKEQLKSHLTKLQGLEFIYEKNLFPELEYIFKHALTQEVAYNSLLIQRRKEMHGKIGNAIEELYTNRMEEFYETLAYHYEKAENWENAQRFYQLSARKAKGNYSNRETYLFSRKTIDALDKLPGNEETSRKKLETRLLMGSILQHIGCPDESIDYLEEGENLAKELGDDKGLSRIYLYISNHYNLKGNPVRAMEYTEKTIEKARKANDVRTMIFAVAAMCLSYYSCGKYTEIVELASRVLGAIEKDGAEGRLDRYLKNYYSQICYLYGLTLGYMGNFKDGEAYLEKGLQITLETGDLKALAACEVHYGTFCFIQGDGEKMHRHATNALNYSEQANWHYMRGLADALMGYSYQLMGDLKKAVKYIEDGLEILIRSGVVYVVSFIYNGLSMMYYETGDFKKSISMAQKALEMSRLNNEKFGEANSKASLGIVMYKIDPLKKDEAERFIKEGIIISESLKTYSNTQIMYCQLGRFYAEAGEISRAKKILKKSIKEMEKMGMMYWPDRARKVLASI